MQDALRDQYYVEPAQRVLWPSTVRLSADYFASLARHAVPLDETRVLASVDLSGRPYLVHSEPELVELIGKRVTGFVNWQRERAAIHRPEVLARIVADHMARTLGQPIIVENVTGAGGTIGITRGSQAKADGHTIMVGQMGTHGAAPAQYPNLKYDPAKDFSPIGLMATTPIVIIAHRDAAAGGSQAEKGGTGGIGRRGLPLGTRRRRLEGEPADEPAAAPAAKPVGAPVPAVAK